jgi:thiamine kinase-like enzyme
MRRRVYHAFFKGHKPVFTHADLDRRNIIIRDDDKTAVLIDWAASGWYPSYWEYCHLATMLVGYEDDWWEWVPVILDEYVAELGWMESHRSLIITGSC